MIDGKVTDQSKFLAGASKKTQRFSIGAFIFKDMVSSQTSTQVGPQKLQIYKVFLRLLMLKQCVSATLHAL